MTAYIFHRLIQALIVLFISSFLIFLVIRFLPGDPILIYLSTEQMDEASPEQIQSIREEFGLDKPLMVQYVRWVYELFHGNLGMSLFEAEEVTRLIGRRFPVTAYLGVWAIVLSTLIGIPAGVICAVRRGGWLDSAVTLCANLGITVPVFWLGILLIYFFSLFLGWLPTFGYTSPFEDFWLSTRQIVMPVICLAVFPIASVARQTRSSMLEVIRQDYTRTAWAKGLRERTIIMRHALKNALIPVITLQGMQIRHILGGSVIVETVFNIPGMGTLAVDAILSHDYPVVQGVVLVIAAGITIANLFVDISYGWLDPRVRYT